jgi:protein-disulfide isomerase
MATKNQIVEIIPQKSVWKGEKQAPVSIVVYGDYESDACSKAHHLINDLTEEYKGKIRYNYRHFPLTQIHQKAQKAAEDKVARLEAEQKEYDLLVTRTDALALRTFLFFSSGSCL